MSVSQYLSFLVPSALLCVLSPAAFAQGTPPTAQSGAAPSATSAPQISFRPDANINNVTIGSLAAVQSQALAADAAKRAGLVPTAQATLATAPAVLVPQKAAAIPLREARLMAILVRQGKGLITEWEERGTLYQRGVHGDVLGWRIEEATATVVKLQSGKEVREVGVGSVLSQTQPVGAKR